jgi:large conductance mechanosensitive channel
MPPIGLLVGGVNFKDLKFVMKDAVLAADGTVETAAVTLNYGNFLQQTFDFLIIAFSIFLMIRIISNLSRKKEEEKPAPAPAPAPEPSAEEKLLTEIRDLLKEKK